MPGGFDFWLAPGPVPGGRRRLRRLIFGANPIRHFPDIRKMVSLLKILMKFYNYRLFHWLPLKSIISYSALNHRLINYANTLYFLIRRIRRTRRIFLNRWIPI